MRAASAMTAKRRAESLMDALVDRDEERAIANAAAAKLRRAAKTAARIEAKAAEAAAKIEAKSARAAAKIDAKPAPKKAGAKAAGDAKAACADTSPAKTPPAKTAPAKAARDSASLPVATSGTPASKPLHPTVSHEGTRKQYLCRTGGKGPGSSLAIKYASVSYRKGGSHTRRTTTMDPRALQGKRPMNG